jgi:hypothetical protein
MEFRNGVLVADGGTFKVGGVLICYSSALMRIGFMGVKKGCALVSKKIIVISST